jgi:YidC/Oxa1 family membrane protein insertase
MNIAEIFRTVLVHPLLNLLVFFYNYIPDIGIVIILVTVVVRLLLFPSFHKSLKHQKALTNLQPKMDEIREKYKDDKERQAKAMMELYKVHKVNPLSSCLPLLIQLPILLALYKVFMQSLNGDALVGLYSFIRVPESINPMFLGFINLEHKNIAMAAVAGILQYFQGRLSQPKVKSKDMTQQIMMQQTMYMFPIMTFILGATLLPAGLTLYWIVTTLFGIGQQYYILRKEAREALYGQGK